MAGVAFAVDGDGVGFATESYAASALYTTLANLSGAFWRIRRAKGFIDTPRDILARAEHEQQIGGLDRRADQMPCVDVGNLSLGWQSGVPILHSPPRFVTGTGGATMPCTGRIAKSRFIAPDCGIIPLGDYLP